MEKFMKKMWKKSEGFTLVELIVVIAILGILAAVAVPAYSGYITKANEAADITSLDAIKTAATAAYAKDGAVTSIAVTANGSGTITEVKVNGSVVLVGTNEAAQAADFDTYVGTLPTLKAYKSGADWSSTTSTWVKKN